MELRIEHLSKTYPNGHQALKDVSLTIPRGMFGLLGPNGAGKSTLMRTLATLQEADSGSARLGDIDVLNDKEAVRRTLGYLPQEFGVYPKVSAEDLLDHFCVLKGVIARSERKALVQQLLTQTNLWESRHRKLGGFSGGMRQRFGIAIALIGKPSLIIVDEPTAGLDPAERQRFLNLLAELGEASIVILSTHLVDDVAELCSRMAIIHDGRIMREGEPLAEIEALRGRVWTLTVEKADAEAAMQQHHVLSKKLFAGRVVLRALSDGEPGPGFVRAEPSLEDVYFATFLAQAPPAVPAAAVAEGA
jgi:ABC-2 type transport system ATP-binding protein